MKKIITFIVLFGCLHLHSQVGIGTTTPDLSSSLDINSNNTGVLIPRVALTMTTSSSPVTAPVESLLVYNTSTINDVVPGFYFWDGSIWRKLASGASVMAQNGLNINTTAPNASITSPYVELGGNLIRNSTVTHGAFNMIYDITGSGNFRINHSTLTASNQATYPFGVSRLGTTEFTIGSDASYAYNQSWNAKPLVINSQGNNTILNPNTNNVGIGLFNPTNKFDLSFGARSGVHGIGLPFYATGNVLSGSSGFEFRHSNGTQGIGLGYNTIYATGTNTDQELGLASRGIGNLNFWTNSIQRMTVSGITGNVGVGVTNPAYGLEINSTFGYGNGTAGAYRSRTETKDNAGQMSSQSGFFETNVPVNYPAGATSWWHLIDTRHSNPANNYSMQIAGSFFDQELWFRKTNNSAATPWSRLLTSTSGWTTLGNSGTNAGTNFVGTIDAVDFVTRTWNAERMRVTATGNVGIGIAGPTQRLDVQGGNARINNVFVGDVGHGANWSGFAHQFQANTTGYSLLSSSDGSYTLINKQNTGGGYIGFRVANADVAVINNFGNMGVGTTAPIARLHAVADADNLPVIYGVNSNTSTGTASYGVRGESGSTGLGSAGVSGVSTNSGQNEIGVVGDYSLWGASVFGLGWAAAYTDMPTTRDFGVFGTVNFSTGTGVYGRNTNTTLGSAYGMYSVGNFAATGAKSASVPTTKGNQLVYCTESPELWFEDIGGAKLVNGSIHIDLDSMFLETIFVNDEHPLRIFIQDEGESNGLIVIKDEDNKGFTVKEKNNGSSSIPFSYRIMGKRRFYQNQRFGVDANQPFEDNLSKAKDQEVTTTDPNVMKQLVEEAARAKQASAK
ncbi:hypothetical protein [Flavobacterium sp.]|uniref:hypothetical protein n=1 Tax=Flavobacterium sp. TaxID=239 RepID=UPI002B4B5412|nr:hypothetical protein [Flavobacterium sp.]HLP65864.1 hypothetical protein [Flavobacterium sp.]